MKQSRHLSQFAFKKEVAARKKQSQIMAFVLFGSGLITEAGVLSVISFGRFGWLTGELFVDLLLVVFLSLLGAALLWQATFLYRKYLCRFCLQCVSEGILQCPHCEEDQTCMDIEIKRDHAPLP